MALRDFLDVNYLPLIDVRPAELLALEELPEKDKDKLLPSFKLRPWVGTDTVEHAIRRLESAYKKRPAFLELGEEELVPPGKGRAVHTELAKLRDANEGYEKWIDFFRREDCQHFIPVLQLGDLQQFPAQLIAMVELERGLALRIPMRADVDAGAFAGYVASTTDGGQDVVFVLDYGKQGSGFPSQLEAIKSSVSDVLAACSNTARIAVSASSFPDGFTEIIKQEIYERTVFESLRSEFGDRILYSDRGSARAERQTGGGGLPAPRIDYAKSKEWFFYRESAKNSTTFVGYQHQAKLLLGSPNWDPMLKLWGCQMIEKTAIGDLDAGITSANRCTAARINIHLHQQLYYGDSIGLYDTDEDWVD
jgi:hypothetical protein